MNNNFTIECLPTANLADQSATEDLSRYAAQYGIMCIVAHKCRQDFTGGRMMLTFHDSGNHQAYEQLYAHVQKMHAELVK